VVNKVKLDTLGDLMFAPDNKSLLIGHSKGIRIMANETHVEVYEDDNTNTGL